MEQLSRSMGVIPPVDLHCLHPQAGDRHAVGERRSALAAPSAQNHQEWLG